MTMSRYEGEKLERLCRDTERLAKEDNKARMATLWADFQRQLAADYEWDQDDVWKAAAMDVQELVAKANREIMARSKARGILPEFAPCISWNWRGRGENAAKERRKELENVAKAELDAELKRANSHVSHEATKIRVELTSGLIQSDQAKAFLAAMPKAADLMPRLDLKKLEVTLRQRRISSGYGYEYAGEDAARKLAAEIDALDDE